MLLVNWAALDESRKANRAAQAAEQNTNSSLIASNRAFGIPKGYSALTANIGPDGGLRQWLFFPIFENSGTTPTKYMRYHVNIWPGEGDWSPEITGFADLWADGMPQEDAPIFLGPKATTWGATLGLHIVDLDNVRRGRKRIFVWGWADYNDIFPNTPRHRTEFCHEIIVMGDPQNPAHISFRGYRTFNGADDECYRQPKPYEPPKT